MLTRQLISSIWLRVQFALWLVVSYYRTLTEMSHLSSSKTARSRHMSITDNVYDKPLADFHLVTSLIPATTLKMGIPMEIGIPNHNPQNWWWLPFLSVVAWLGSPLVVYHNQSVDPEHLSRIVFRYFDLSFRFLISLLCAYGKKTPVCVLWRQNRTCCITYSWCVPLTTKETCENVVRIYAPTQVVTKRFSNISFCSYKEYFVSNTFDGDLRLTALGISHLIALQLDRLHRLSITWVGCTPLHQISGLSRSLVGVRICYVGVLLGLAE